jgi:hypothetical protein
LLDRYSSLADQNHWVFLFIFLPLGSHFSHCIILLSPYTICWFSGLSSDIKCPVVSLIKL